MKKPFLKFYIGDWRGDEELRMCSIAARGLWLEMLLLMARATPYGHLLVNGASPTDNQLSNLTAVPVDQLPDLLGELEKYGVYSRNRNGVIFSRKLARMEKKSKINAENGRNGGAGKHKKPKGNSGLGKRSPSESLAKDQAPEARGQSLEKKNNIKEKPPDPGDPPWFESPNIRLRKSEFDSLFQRFSFDGNEDNFHALLSRWSDESLMPVTFTGLETRLMRAGRKRRELEECLA